VNEEDGSGRGLCVNISSCANEKYSHKKEEIVFKKTYAIIIAKF